MTTDQVQRRGLPGGSVTGRRTAAPSRARRRRPRRTAQWRAQSAAWAFLAPVVVYLRRLLRLPALPQHRPEHPDYTVASFVTGDAPFVGFANYSSVFHRPDVLARA